jgi:hypothetical protein
MVQKHHTDVPDVLPRPVMTSLAALSVLLVRSQPIEKLVTSGIEVRGEFFCRGTAHVTQGPRTLI